jgi:hypothetical protein
MLERSFRLRSIFTTTTLLLAFASTAATGLGAGTDILHFFDRAAFTGDASASGSVFARENKQGHADNQSVSISLKGLDTNAPYTLLISTVDDTNLVSASSFTTDAHGKVKFNFNRKADGKGNGKGASPLPDVMAPVAGLRSFAVVNVNTQTVLTADLTAPTQLQYLIKRDLSTNDITATLRIKASTSNIRLRLSARGLPATNDFYLVLNGGIAQTNTSDTHGRLDVATALINPNDILDLRSVMVWDTASNVVVTTTLP